jgi:hypothetical protein
MHICRRIVFRRNVCRRIVLSPKRPNFVAETSVAESDCRRNVLSPKRLLTHQIAFRPPASDWPKVPDTGS